MTKHSRRFSDVVSLRAVIYLLVLCAAQAIAAPGAFVAFDPKPDFVLPDIVLQYDPATNSGANWEKVADPQWYEATPPVVAGRAANFLREGLTRMTGKAYAVVSQPDVSRGLVLMLRVNAPAALQDDPQVKAALDPVPDDQYAANEAFFIRSEPDRVVLIANTADGLAHAVVELLESVNYEVLGMGPNWTHVPDHRGKALTFAINTAGRPSYYIRSLWATSGQSYGVGTIMSGLTDPADETVTASYIRWQIGSRTYGSSMPPFPGHALQAFHKPVLEKMRLDNNTQGFLTPKTVIGADAARPEASADNAGWLWINNDAEGGVFVSDGKTWNAQALGQIVCNLDLSVPFVREIILRHTMDSAQTSFTKHPDKLVIIGIDPEDGGGYAALDTCMANKNWYPDYLAAEGLQLGKPYVLHGFLGLDQPVELWDGNAASDVVYGFANWLLREMDKWIDAMPADERVTATGRSKKDLLRCSFYSYNYHDVPPNFNVDPRVRVMIASYPKHRGRGKWEAYNTQEMMARAFQVMLPREPSGDYRIISLSYYHDPGPSGIPARWSAAAASIAADFRRAHDAGYRAMSMETDFNFGKFGLAYYLISKMLWNANLTAEQLDAIRDRWFQRAFGDAWQEMKAYYDFMLTDNYIVNGPNTWARAIRLIAAADEKLAGSNDLASQKRLDDVKQYWYYHYLMDSGKFTTASPQVREYLWKGQMSYMVALHVLARRDFGTNAVAEAVGPQLSAGPAHYTHEETQAWWTQVLAHWPLTEVTQFSDVKLADGRPAKVVDLNDLVAVVQFRDGGADSPFLYNSGYMEPVPFLMTAGRAGDPLGFRMWWPFNPDDGYYTAKKLPYGVERWDALTRAWVPWIDINMTFSQSQEQAGADGRKYQVVSVDLTAPRPGTYRFAIGYGGNLSYLGSYACNPIAGTYAKPAGFTYFSNASGLTQSPAYFYIPKGTKSIDLEVWDEYKVKWLHLSPGLPKQSRGPARKVDVSAMGTHRVALEPGEDGTIAMVQGNGFAFPHLYSVPSLWAKSPGALLVPRMIAEADKLTPIR